MESDIRMAGVDNKCITSNTIRSIDDGSDSDGGSEDCVVEEMLLDYVMDDRQEKKEDSEEDKSELSSDRGVVEARIVKMAIKEMKNCPDLMGFMLFVVCTNDSK